METAFKASQFKPTKWNSAEDKAKFGNHFLRFVEGQFAKELFPRWFYERLCQTFGHIAHYNQAGFFEEFFTTPEDKVRFLELTANYVPVGDPEWTYSDVEREIVRVVRARGYLAGYQTKLLAATESTEKAELARLKAKYETPA